MYYKNPHAPMVLLLTTFLNTIAGIMGTIIGILYLLIEPKIGVVLLGVGLYCLAHLFLVLNISVDLPKKGEECVVCHQKVKEDIK